MSASRLYARRLLLAVSLRAAIGLVVLFFLCQLYQPWKAFDAPPTLLILVNWRIWLSLALCAVIIWYAGLPATWDTWDMESEGTEDVVEPVEAPERTVGASSAQSASETFRRYISDFGIHAEDL